MADRIELFDVTVPAGTLLATPQTTPMPFQRGRVDRVDIRVPPGPSGLVGFRISHSGQVIIPRSGSAWIVTDDDKLTWDLDNYPTGDAWECVIYNSDTYSHTIQIQFHITELGLASAPVVTPLVIQPVAESEDVGLDAEEG